MGGDNDLLFRPAADAPGSAKASPVALPQHKLRCSIRRQSDTGAPATQRPVERQNGRSHGPGSLRCQSDPG